SRAKSGTAQAMGFLVAEAFQSLSAHQMRVQFHFDHASKVPEPDRRPLSKWLYATTQGPLANNILADGRPAIESGPDYSSRRCAMGMLTGAVYALTGVILLTTCLLMDELRQPPIIDKKIWLPLFYFGAFLLIAGGATL